MHRRLPLVSKAAASAEVLLLWFFGLSGEPHMTTLYRTLIAAIAALCSLKPLTVLALMLTISSAQAALIDRGEGFIYDDVLDITWTQDANLNGAANWDDQVAWADELSLTHSVYGTFDDWRLPDMDRNGDENLVYCPIVSESACRDNEFAYLYYYYGITLDLPGIFTNIQFNNYWSITEHADDPYAARGFEFTFGGSIGDFKSEEYNSWAVRAGDVVPIPAAVWLFGSALLGLGWMRRA